MATKQSLKECRVFEALSDPEIERILALGVDKEYAAGEVVFRQGNPATDLYLLKEGKLALQTMFAPEPSQMPRRVTVDIVSRNDVFGWSAVVEPHQYTLTAVCLQPTKAFAINGPKLRSLIRENNRLGFEVLDGLIKVVASRLDETVKLLISERQTALRPE